MGDFLSTKSINKYLLFYVFINLLFVFKYSHRISLNIAVTTTILYTILIILFFNFLVWNQNKINRFKNFNIFFIVISLLAIAFYIFLNIYVDGKSLNVDRWSAMSVGIKNLLNGNYPYTAIDHLGGRTSNFPGLFFLGLPFYLLGNVGFLQVFVFVLLSWYVYKFIPTNFQRILIISLFILSPAYLWEIYAKSDLMSNLILLFIFIDYWSKKHRDNLFNQPLIAGIIIGVLTMTRGVVVLVLLIYFFKAFFIKITKQKMLFLFTIIATILLLILPIYITMPAWDIVKEKNPLALQTSLLPSYLYLIFILSAILLSYIINKKRIIWWAFLIIFIPVLTSFVLFIYEFGFERSLLQSRFDISYFNMSLTFIIFWLATYISTNATTPNIHKKLA